METSLTFEDLTRNLAYIKVVWNHKVVFDDTNPKVEVTLEDFTRFRAEFGNKFVYEMKVKVVQFHHCILFIKGEK